MSAGHILHPMSTDACAHKGDIDDILDALGLMMARIDRRFDELSSGIEKLQNDLYRL